MPDSGPPVPARVSHYRTVGRLGAGGMGQVLEAVDLRDGSHLALKLMWPNLAVDPAFQERFEREAHVAALLRSPYTVHLIDYGVADGSYFLAMEFVEGETLDAKLKREGALAPPEALHLAIDIARALEEAEAREVVHRDLKPENVMITPEGRAKVTDFGVARDAGAGALTMTQAFIGTPQYGAPEQFEGVTDSRSDQYSFGVILFRMLTGAPPFSGTVFELRDHHRMSPVPVERLASLPAGLQATVIRCLAKSPADRFPNIPSLLRALRGVQAAFSAPAAEIAPASFVPPAPVPAPPRTDSWTSQPSAPYPPTPSVAASAAPGVVRPRSRRGLLTAVIAGALVAAALTAGVLFATRGGGDDKASSDDDGSSAGATETSEAGSQPLNKGGKLHVAVPVLNATDLGNAVPGEALYETLIVIDTQGVTSAGLAESWEQSDATTLVLKIREGVAFHDGVVLDAAVVVASLKEYGVGPGRGTSLIRIKTITAVDSHTVRIVYAAPEPKAIADLAATPIRKPGSNPAKGPIGTGPFAFAEYKPGLTLTIQRFEHYWDSPTLLDEITFFLAVDSGVRRAGLQTGEFDVVTELSAGEFIGLGSGLLLGVCELKNYAYREGVVIGCHGTAFGATAALDYARAAAK